MTAVKEADEWETQDDNTTTLSAATTYTKQQREKTRKVKSSHLSLHYIWLKHQTPKGDKTAYGLPWTKKTSEHTAHTTTTFHPYLLRGIFPKNAT